jgi:hypothetical protein
VKPFVTRLAYFAWTVLATLLLFAVGMEQKTRFGSLTYTEDAAIEEKKVI